MILVISLYLFGMVVFFLAGFAILSKKLSVSRLPIANHLWLLGLFCLLHGLYDGIKLYNTFSNQWLLLDPGSGIWFFRYLFLGAAFSALGVFGLRMIDEISLVSSYFNSVSTRFVILLFVCSAALISLLAGGAMDEFWLRWCIALPASLLSGLSLMFYSRQLTQRTQQGAESLRLAGICMLAFGAVSVIILPHSSAAYASYLILCLRALAAGLFVFFILQALSIFDAEQLDILEERLARFAQSERLTSLGRLAAGVAHEINNPLANAALNLDMLGDELDVPEKAQRRIATINHSLDRASNIARELLQVSRDAEHDEPRPLSLRKLIESAVQLVTAQSSGVQIKVQCDSDAEVDCIGWKLEEVLINLLQNAIDASSPGEEVEVALVEEDKWVRVSVSDRGSGVASADREKIFEPFFTTKEPGKGTGLGLAVCYAIVEVHRGKLSFEDRRGGGSIFTLTLARSRHE